MEPNGEIEDGQNFPAYSSKGSPRREVGPPLANDRCLQKELRLLDAAFQSEVENIVAESQKDLARIIAEARKRNATKVEIANTIAAAEDEIDDDGGYEIIGEATDFGGAPLAQPIDTNCGKRHALLPLSQKFPVDQSKGSPRREIGPPLANDRCLQKELRLLDAAFESEVENIVAESQKDLARIISEARKRNATKVEIANTIAAAEGEIAVAADDGGYEIIEKPKDDGGEPLAQPIDTNCSKRHALHPLRMDPNGEIEDGQKFPVDQPKGSLRREVGPALGNDRCLQKDLQMLDGAFESEVEKLLAENQKDLVRMIAEARKRSAAKGQIANTIAAGEGETAVAADDGGYEIIEKSNVLGNREKDTTTRIGTQRPASKPPMAQQKKPQPQPWMTACMDAINLYRLSVIHHLRQKPQQPPAALGDDLGGWKRSSRDELDSHGSDSSCETPKRDCSVVTRDSNRVNIVNSTAAAEGQCAVAADDGRDGIMGKSREDCWMEQELEESQQFGHLNGTHHPGRKPQPTESSNPIIPNFLRQNKSGWRVRRCLGCHRNIDIQHVRWTYSSRVNRTICRKTYFQCPISAEVCNGRCVASCGGSGQTNNDFLPNKDAIEESRHWAMDGDKELPAAIVRSDSDSLDGTEKKVFKIFVNGVYSGQMNSHGERDGNGTFSWISGSVYKGEWKKDMPHGLGTFRWADGDVYHGEYRNGIKAGRGTYAFTRGKRMGDKYVGDFNNDSMEGRGTYHFADGTVCTGEFKGDSFVG